MKSTRIFLCFALLQAIFVTSTACATETPTQQVAAMITRAYRMVLNRFPDPGGLTTYENAFYGGVLDPGAQTVAGSGVPVTAANLSTAYGNLLLILRRSAESQADVTENNGSSWEVIRMYHDMLNRNPDPEGGANWTQLLLGGGNWTYTSMRQAFVNSPECQNDIANAFLSVQNTPPDAQQIAWADAYLNAGGSIQAMIAHLQTPQRSSVIDLAWINSTVIQNYLNVLDREPDWGGGIYYSFLVLGGLSQTQFISDLANSVEFTNTTLNNAYQEVLGRNVDPSGLATYQALVASGATINQVRADLWASDECANNANCGNIITLDPPPAAYTWPNFASVFAGGTDFQPEGCNTVVYGTTPNLGDFMIGRMQNGMNGVNGANGGGGFIKNSNGSYTFNTACSSMPYFSLTWVQMDWVHNKVLPLSVILDTTNPIGVEYPAATLGVNPRYLLTQAFDPTVAPFQGQYWVAFNCEGSEYGVQFNAAGTCAGPLVWKPGSPYPVIDQTRISVVAKNVDNPATPGVYHSAGVPKIVDHLGHLYLYWDTVTINTNAISDYLFDNTLGSEFAGVATRGVELQVDPASGRLYAKGNTQAIASDDDTTSTEVLANADTSQVISYDGNLLAISSSTYTGTLGENNTCSEPLNMPANLPPCYRLIFSQTQSPLAYHGFQPVSAATALPDAAVYFRFMYRQEDGSTIMHGQVFDNPSYHLPTPPTTSATVVRSNEIYYPWPANLLTPVCNPVSNPWPSYMELNNKCLPSCSVLGGTGSQAMCPSGHDLGESYDQPYCCTAATE